MFGEPGRVLLISTTNAFEAHVIHAHLEAEGIPSDLSGAVDGPYRFALGSMAEIGVWVAQDRIDDARLVMLAAEIDASVGAEPSPRPTSGWRSAVVAGVVVTTMLLVTLARLAQNL